MLNTAYNEKSLYTKNQREIGDGIKEKGQEHSQELLITKEKR
jgi:hypothetical protein